MKNIQIISDKNNRSKKIKDELLKILYRNNFKDFRICLVIGGDGFMLQTLKKNKNVNKLFYGINSGNYGFLMNKFSSKSRSYQNLFHRIFFLNFYYSLKFEA